MASPFKALKEAHVASERARRQFDLRLALGVGAILLIVVLQYLKEQISPAVLVGMLGAGQDFAVYFFNKGVQFEVWLMAAFLLFLLRERLVVHALRTYHEDNPQADRTASERWLARRLTLLYAITALLTAPFLVAWFFALTLSDLVELYWVIAPLVCMISVFVVWGWQYRPIDLAAEEGLRRAAKDAREVGYSYGRYRDINPQEVAAPYPEGPVLSSYLEGVREGARVRAKLKRRGVIENKEGKDE